MRARFGNHIELCTRVRHTEGSKLLLISTSNGVYVVDCADVVVAENLLNKALIDGYIDVSCFDYSN